MAELKLGVLTFSALLLKQKNMPSEPESAASLFKWLLSPSVSPRCWSSFSCVLTAFLVLSHLLIGGYENGLIEMGLKGKFEAGQRCKNLQLKVGGWKPWAPGCEMWTWCRHLVGVGAPQRWIWYQWGQWAILAVIFRDLGTPAGLKKFFFHSPWDNIASW